MAGFVSNLFLYFNIFLYSLVVGGTYEQFHKQAAFSNLQILNPNTFYKIQRTLIIPTISEHYEKVIKASRHESKGVDPVILGDGRFDSPGKSAKYCTYSFQSTSTKKVLVCSTIQTITGKGSATLEMKGFQNCLSDLESDHFPVSTVATDRNKQIAKWVRNERAALKHKYDAWHFVKNINSKLRPLAKRKACNHLF